MDAQKQKALAMAKALEPHVNTVLLSEVLAEATRQRVQPVKEEVLARYDYRINLELGGHREKDHGEKITDPEKLHLTTDDCTPYYAELHERYVAMGYDDLPEVGYCPLLIAEHLKIDAENELLDAGCEMLGIESGRVYGKNRKKMLDLLIGLVVNAPGYIEPKLPA